MYKNVLFSKLMKLQKASLPRSFSFVSKLSFNIYFLVTVNLMVSYCKVLFKSGRNRIFSIVLNLDFCLDTRCNAFQFRFGRFQVYF